MIVSGRLDLPWDAPVFEDRGARVLIFTTSDADPPETVAEVRVVRHEGSVDLVKALEYLRTQRGVRALLCEGGPRLHAQLIEAALVDELFVTHAPKLAGGDGPSLAVGLPELERPLEVAWLLDADGELFARYRVPGAGPDPLDRSIFNRRGSLQTTRRERPRKGTGRAATEGGPRPWAGSTLASPQREA